MKKYIFITIFSFIVTSSLAQVKVYSNGGLTVGSTNTAPSQGLIVQGNTGIGVTSPGVKFEVIASGGASDGFKLGNTLNTNFLRFISSNPTPEIGTNGDKITFYNYTVGYNKLYAESYTSISDAKYKTDVRSISNNLEKIKQLKGVKYKLVENSENLSETPLKDNYGFIAQELQLVLPELVNETPRGDLGIDYMGIIPVVVEAIKEQQSQIETLQTIIKGQETEIAQLKNATETKSADFSNNNIFGAALQQNTPNPFSEKTQINYSVEQGFSKGQIIIYNLQGNEIKSFEIKNTGKGSVSLSASELQPGMYLYTLMIDNIIIDTKRMILTTK